MSMRKFGPTAVNFGSRIFGLQQHFVRNLFLRHRVDEAHIASMCVIHTPYRCDERSKGCTNLPVYLLSFIFLAVLFLGHH